MRSTQDIRSGPKEKVMVEVYGNDAIPLVLLKAANQLFHPWFGGNTGGSVASPVRQLVVVRQRVWRRTEE